MLAIAVVVSPKQLLLGCGFFLAHIANHIMAVIAE